MVELYEVLDPFLMEGEIVTPFRLLCKVCGVVGVVAKPALLVLGVAASCDVFNVADGGL